MAQTVVNEYQTLIVGGLGFFGVMVTMAFNAWQSRQQLREELRHERQAMRVALIEELKIYRDSLISNAQKKEAAENSEGKVAYVPTDPWKTPIGRSRTALASYRRRR